MSRKEWLMAAILTLITIIAWAVFNVMHTRAEVQIPQKLQEVIEPISPDFDIESIQAVP